MTKLQLILKLPEYGKRNISHYLLLLALSLLRLFIHLILSARRDSAAIIARLANSNGKLLRMQHSSDRTFEEPQLYFRKKMKNVFVEKKKQETIGAMIQTDFRFAYISSNSNFNHVRDTHGLNPY